MLDVSFPLFIAALNHFDFFLDSVRNDFVVSICNLVVGVASVSATLSAFLVSHPVCCGRGASRYDVRNGGGRWEVGYGKVNVVREVALIL